VGGGVTVVIVVGEGGVDAVVAGEGIPVELGGAAGESVPMQPPPNSDIAQTSMRGGFITAGYYLSSEIDPRIICSTSAVESFRSGTQPGADSPGS
jgi:hypothetical protein